MANPIVIQTPIQGVSSTPKEFKTLEEASKAYNDLTMQINSLVIPAIKNNFEGIEIGLSRGVKDIEVNNVVATTDIYTTAWTDRSGSITAYGWSSTTNKKVYYKKIGKLIYVVFSISGTSNSTSAALLGLPSTALNISGLPFRAALGSTMDNGVNIATGTAEINPGTTIINLFTSAMGAWTNSGTKAVSGMIWYEVV